MFSQRMTNSLRPILIAAGLLGSLARANAQSTTAQRGVDELLAVDREQAGRALRLNAVDALAGIFADDVVMPAMGAFHNGREAALAQLRSVPENLNGRLEWDPLRGGISADGQHGFTFGFMTLVRADSTRMPLKYLAYWVKKSDGWKVAVYRRVVRPAGEVANAMREPSLPERTVDVTHDATIIARHARELGDAERNFSTLAGKIGLGRAFTQNAAPDAMNMGGPQSANFLFGPEAIGAGVGAGQTGPSTLTWGPDTVLVATSGDLGVTIGHILPKPEPGVEQRRIPFFTVWKKVGGVWKFVAE
jgi:ketosteroid isomerase-like protein